jgi:hypothetical protein
MRERAIFFVKSLIIWRYADKRLGIVDLQYDSSFFTTSRNRRARHGLLDHLVFRRTTTTNISNAMCPEIQEIIQYMISFTSQNRCALMGIQTRRDCFGGQALSSGRSVQAKPISCTSDRSARAGPRSKCLTVSSRAFGCVRLPKKGQLPAPR